ncbi:hypothetical protein OG225_41315 (plasmid) [Nocardia sp. NBC_01377]
MVGDRVEMPSDLVSFCWGLASRDDVELLWVNEPDEPLTVGSVVIDEQPSADFLQFRVWSEGGRTVGRAVSLYSQWEEFAERDAPDVGLPQDRWLDQILVARVAVELRCDVFITTRGETLGYDGRYITEANPMAPQDALFVLGLYLRSRNRDCPIVAPAQLVMPPSDMFRIAVDAIMPSGRPWAAALYKLRWENDIEEPSRLVNAFRERLSWVLRYRDRLHIALLAPHDNDTAENVRADLSNLLYNLVGAFDAAARVAHLCAGNLPKDQRKAGWQNPTWLKSLNNTALSDLFGNSSRGSDVFAACRNLRNTIHGEGLSSTALQEQSAPLQTMVRIPDSEVAALTALLDRLDGPISWGLRTIPGAGTLIDTAPFIERLVPEALAVLDEAIRLTPTEQLTGVDPATVVGRPFDASEQATHHRIALLLGLGAATEVHPAPAAASTAAVGAASH